MSEDAIFDGKISICHTIEHREEVSVAEYNLRMAAQFMTEEELAKVLKYINRITQKRLPFCLTSKDSRLKPNKYTGKKVY